MAVKLSYSPNKEDLEIRLPASKSESNRLLVLQFLSEVEVKDEVKDEIGTFEIDNLSDAGDTQVLQTCLEQIKNRQSEETIKLDCRDGGTPLRFLMAVCALVPGSFLLTGTPRLMQRPQKDLIDSLVQSGAKIHCLGEKECGPYLVEGGKLKSGAWEIDMQQSSQFASALLLIAPFMQAPIELTILHREASWPYVEMTLQSLKKLGVRMEWKGKVLCIYPGIHSPKKIIVEADWSSAAFFYAAQAMRKKGSLFFPDLKMESLQGDAFVERLFRYEGIQSEQGEEGVKISWHETAWKRNELSINLQSYPDLAPALVVYFLSEGRKINWSGLESLAKKESVRDQVLGEMLNACGAEWEIGDGRWNQSGSLDSASSVLSTAEDHRMVMAFALMAICGNSIALDDIDSVKKSFPGFWEEIGKLGISA